MQVAYGGEDAFGRLYRDRLRMAEALGPWREVAFQLSGPGLLALLTGDLPAPGQRQAPLRP